MKDLDELVELAKKATPGKWWIDSHGHSMVAFSGEAGDVEIVFATDNDMGPLVRHEDTGNLSHWRNDNDATFIAATNPETILTLIARIKAQDEELLELRKAFSEPAAYEVKGVLCHTRIEAEIYFGEPEPLYRKPEATTPPQ